MQARESTPSPTPSLTALTVAAAFMRALEMGYQDWFEPNDLLLIKRMVAAAIKNEPALWKKVLSNSVSGLPNTYQRTFFDKLVVNGYDIHILTRKLMIKEHIEAAIRDRGVTQVVFLGGGYDIRAIMSARNHPGVNFFEIDRGDTRKIKMNALNELGDLLNIVNQADGTKTVNYNLRYISCDLSKESLSETLKQHGYNSTQKTLVIAEGLTMYLTQDAMAATMTSLAGLLHDDDEVLLSFISAQNDSSVLAKIIRYLNNEEYKFSLKPEDVCAFVNSFGFSVEAKTNHAKLSEHAGDKILHDYYVEHPPLHKETYYYLRRSALALNNRQDNVKDVPDIILTTPLKEADPRQELKCAVL